MTQAYTALSVAEYLGRNYSTPGAPGYQGVSESEESEAFGEPIPSKLHSGFFSLEDFSTWVATRIVLNDPQAEYVIGASVAASSLAIGSGAPPPTTGTLTMDLYTDDGRGPSILIASGQFDLTGQIPVVTTQSTDFGRLAVGSLRAQAGVAIGGWFTPEGVRSFPVALFAEPLVPQLGMSMWIVAHIDAPIPYVPAGRYLNFDSQLVGFGADWAYLNDAGQIDGLHGSSFANLSTYSRFGSYLFAPALDLIYTKTVTTSAGDIVVPVSFSTGSGYGSASNIRVPVGLMAASIRPQRMRSFGLVIG